MKQFYQAVILAAPEKSGGGPPQSKTLARLQVTHDWREAVLNCASPLALSVRMKEAAEK